MLTRRQQTQIRTAFMSAVFGANKIIFVVQNSAYVSEFAQFLSDSYGGTIDIQFRKLGPTIKVSVKEGRGTLHIEPHMLRDQYMGRTFSGVFVDEAAVLDSKTLDLLATRVRRP